MVIVKMCFLGYANARIVRPQGKRTFASATFMKKLDKKQNASSLAVLTSALFAFLCLKKEYVKFYQSNIQAFAWYVQLQ